MIPVLACDKKEMWSGRSPRVKDPDSNFVSYNTRGNIYDVTFYLRISLI